MAKSDEPGLHPLHVENEKLRDALAMAKKNLNSASSISDNREAT